MSNIVTGREKNRILRYYLGTVLSGICVGVAVCIGFLWGLLVMIDDLAFCSHDFYDLGLEVYLGIVVVYMVVFCYGMLGPRLGMNGKSWGALVEKVARTTGRATATDPEGLADAIGMKLPNGLALVIAAIAIPVVLMIGVYVPQFMHSASAMEANQQVAIQTMDTLNEAFDGKVEKVYFGNPREGYRDGGYMFSAYACADRGSEIELIVDVDYSGQIADAFYVADIDVKKDKFQQKHAINAGFKTLNDIVAGIEGVPAKNPNVLSPCALSDDFWEQFEDRTYFEDFSWSVTRDDGVKVRCTYNSYPEDRITEYSVPQIYLSCK